jgi:D-tyrosyl-tRNA(Tyr) deacylase
MRAIVQRVSKASVTVDDAIIGEIAVGLVVLLGVGREDTEADAGFLAAKITELRIFPDEHGKMNRSVIEVNGALLVISQFTLYGDCRKGRRPSFDHAAEPDQANRLYQHFINKARLAGVVVQTGKFQARMQVHLTNDGPVTFIVDSGR